MLIIGCDFHSRFQQIALLDPQTGEVIERRLEHENGEARKFYAGLGTPARVGMEATGYAQWFERMLAEQWGARNYRVCHSVPGPVDTIVIDSIEKPSPN
jgi:hypothetical protein